MNFLPLFGSSCALSGHSRLSQIIRLTSLAAAVFVADDSCLEAGIVGRQRVATGLNAPMFTTFAPGDSTRLFIAERGSGSDGQNATAAIRVLHLTTGLIVPTP